MNTQLFVSRIYELHIASGRTPTFLTPSTLPLSNVSGLQEFVHTQRLRPQLSIVELERPQSNQGIFSWSQTSQTLFRMPFSDLATELIFETASYIDSDDTTTLLHLAVVNQRLFAIVMPKLIATQSTRIQELDFVHHILASTPIERICLKPNEITYNNWFHKDCRNNAFAQSYGDIYLRFQHQLPMYIYTHACALIRRAPRINQVFFEIQYNTPSDSEWIGRFLDICAQRSPPPRVVMVGECQSSSVQRESRYSGKFSSPLPVRCDYEEIAMRFKRRRLPLRILKGIARNLTTLFPMLFPQDAGPYPRQPPRVSTRRSYHCACKWPTHPVSVGKNPNLQELDIRSDSMFVPSMYPYTVDFINLAPLTSLSFRNIKLDSPAWSQILYCLQIPALTTFILQNVSVAFLDIIFFLQRHQSITHLGLFLDLCRWHNDGDYILPDHFDLPNLEGLSASGVYAALLMHHHTGPRFKKLRSIVITTPLSASSDGTPTKLFRLYDLLAAHYEQYAVMFLLFPFHSSYFVEWALQRMTAPDRPGDSRGVLGAACFGTSPDVEMEIPEQTFASMLNWVKENCDGWSRYGEAQCVSRSHVLQEFICAVCPLGVKYRG